MGECDWIVGICNTEADGVRIFRFRGTIEEMKEELVSLIKEDRNNDEENWSYGCDEINDIRAEDKQIAGTYIIYKFLRVAYLCC